MQASRPSRLLAVVFPFLEIPRVRPTRNIRLPLRIKATTENQVVTLSGDANLYMDKGNLTHRVEKIKEVEAVHDHLQVEGTVPDDQLRHTLADRLRSDRVAFGIAFNAISLTVLNGVAPLYGVVHNDPDKNIAGIRAKQISGVFNVDHHLLALNQTNK